MSIAGNENSDIISRPADRAPREGFAVSTQDILRGNSATIPICPDCHEPMVFKGKKHIPLTNLADVRYRCDTCDVENKRTIKDRDRRGSRGTNWPAD
jgi:hypothetical protein